MDMQLCPHIHAPHEPKGPLVVASCDKHSHGVSIQLLAQLDLANGTRFQVQMKDRLTVFHLHLKSRAVRKIRLHYTELELHASVYHMSQISGDPL